MTNKELKEYLDTFPDKAEVVLFLPIHKKENYMKYQMNLLLQMPDNQCFALKLELKNQWMKKW